MVMCHSIYDLFISAKTEKLLLNGEVFSKRHNYFSNALITKNHRILEPRSLNVLILCNANNIIFQANAITSEHI